MILIALPHEQTTPPTCPLESYPTCRRCAVGFDDEAGVDGDGLGGVVGLEDAHEAVGQLEHLGTQGDDDELGVLGALLRGEEMA